MEPSRVKVSFDGGEVTAALYGTGGTPLLLAHGAGTDQWHARMVGLAEALAGEGAWVMTFNYPYTEAGKKRPDPMASLLACHRAARDHLAVLAGREVVLSGRSMGGRMATYLAAAGEPARALVLYAYPLHPAGQHDKLRTAHLPDISIPMLFFQGTRDALSRQDLFDRHVRPLPNATVELLAGATHALDRSPAHTLALARRTMDWLGTLPTET